MKVINNSGILNIYKMTVDEEHRRAFSDISKRNMVTSVTIEGGTLAMYNTVNEQGENLIVELYNDKHAFDVHHRSAQYQDSLAVAKDAVKESQKVELIPHFLGEQDVSLNATTDNNMRVNLVHFTLKEGQGEQFKRILADYLKTAMKAETEILVCYVAQIKERPNDWLTFQVFQNDGTFNNYVNSDGFKTVQKKLAPMLEDRQLEQLDGQVLMNKGHY